MTEHVVVRCPSCTQKYRVVRPSVGLKARCRKCGQSFLIEADRPVDDDAIVAWITEDDPSSRSVMGSTGIFENVGDAGLPAEQSRQAAAAPAATGGEGAEPHAAGIVLRRLDSVGAHFQFPAEALTKPAIRMAFPHKCVGCGAREHLRIHLVYWPERMPAQDAPQWKHRMDICVGRLDAIAGRSERSLLEKLPPSRHVGEPFSLPFPAFACEYCSPSRELYPRVVVKDSGEWCRLTISYLPVAVDFFRTAGGRNTPEYRRLIEERDQRRDGWRELDPRVRHRLSKWFDPPAGEQFIGFYPDADFSVAEAGNSGLVLTSRRLLFKKYAARREYPLDRAGRIEVLSRGDDSTIHIYESGQQPAILKLARGAADALAASIRTLRCRWVVVG